ncbi:hypothetical protein KC330_g8251 [Hortaea werneckii]|nr:hypothetical protein KC330_g8251 [Hortaea werneckii]
MLPGNGPEYSGLCTDDVPRSYRALADHSNVIRSTLHDRAQGQRSIEAKAQSQQYLTPYEEKTMIDFILQMSALGTPVRIKYISSIAFTVASGRPEHDRPQKPPGKNWAKALEKRHPELKAKRVKALDWDRHEKNIYPKIEAWFELTGKVLDGPDILSENVYNMDETGVMLSKLGSVKVLVATNDVRDYRGARWLTRVFDPQTSERANGKPRVLICDGFGTHEKLEILVHCLTNNIKLCRLPSHTSHKLQPCDIAVFAPLKTAYRDNAERLERGVNTIGKQHFTSLYSPAREAAFTKRNILAGWSKGGLFPFNPQRVLRDIDKPYAELREAAGEPVAPGIGFVAAPPPSPASVTLVSPVAPVTPVTPITPVSAETFTSLQNTIVREDARRFDDVDKHALQEGHIRFLHKINNEGEARRSTRAIVLGTAKVMSWEDLEEAKAKRAEQKEKEVRKITRAAGGKRKEKSPKAHDSLVEVGGERTGEGSHTINNGADQLAEPRCTFDGPLAPGPGNAPVARMWFKAVGDIDANVDPVHIGLPWAGVRAILEVALADSNQRAVLVTGIELALYVSNRLKVYLETGLSPSAGGDNLRKSIVILYAHVLVFLARAICIQQRGRAERVMTALWNLGDLTEFEDQCDKLCTLRKIHEFQTGLLRLDAKVDLSKLETAKEATYDSSAEGELPRCLPDTRTNLLQQIFDWAAGHGGKRIFWLCGKAGTGKSTICRTVAQKLDADGLLGGSFFFKR